MEPKEIISKFDEILVKYKKAHEIELEALDNLYSLKLEIVTSNKEVVTERVDNKEIIKQLNSFPLGKAVTLPNGLTAVKLPLSQDKPNKEVKNKEKTNKIIFCRKCHSRITNDNYVKLDNGLYLCEKCSK